MASDYMECQAGDWQKREVHLSYYSPTSLGENYFLSIFGVAWGVIPEVFCSAGIVQCIVLHLQCDLASEFLRRLGPIR